MRLAGLAARAAMIAAGLAGLTMVAAGLTGLAGMPTGLAGLTRLAGMDAGAAGESRIAREFFLLKDLVNAVADIGQLDTPVA